MLEIRDPKLLAALQRALYEAKFERAAEDALEIAGSPYVAEAFRQVVAAYIVASKAQGDLRDVVLTEQWLRAEEHPHALDIVREQIRLTERWLKMKDDAKAVYVRDLLSPLVAPDEMVAAMVEEGNSYHQRRG